MGLGTQNKNAANTHAAKGKIRSNRVLQVNKITQKIACLKNHASAIKKGSPSRVRTSSSVK